MPGAEKPAVVSGLPASWKMTVPGPENLLQVVVRVLPEGRPSSLAVPSSVMPLGSVTV